MEAIGLGHDVGHPPFGHIGEGVLDACRRERFGRGFRHNEHSLRVVDVLEDLNLTEPVRDGILRHSAGAGEPATLEGKIVRLRRPDRLHQPRHRRRAARRRARARRPAGGGDRGARATRARGGSTRLVHDLVEHSEAAGDIVQGDEVGPAMLRLRTFMFEHVYLGPARAPSTRRSSGCCAGCSTGTCEQPERAARRASRAPRTGRPRDRLPRRDDRPLRDPRLDRALRAAGLRAV